MSFTLPRITNEDFNGYLKMVDPDSMEKIAPNLDRVLRTTRSNPRGLKRFLNDLHLEAGIHRNRETGVEFDDLLAMKFIEFEAPALKKETAGTVMLVKDKISELGEKNDLTGDWDIPSAKIGTVTAVSLRPYLENRRLVNLLRHMNIDRGKIEQIFTISQAVGGEGGIAGNLEGITEVENAEFSGYSELATYPMVRVEPGSFLYGENKEAANIEESYEIDVYPVTNGQFGKFILDGGYEDGSEWWSKEGDLWRRKEKIVKPEYFDDKKWNAPDRPVIGVSFYEADAYARWAGKRLPTEMEWERAARGTDGREFPWGDEFDSEKCNTVESGINRTTRVTRYPNGISLVGCYDMAGNVWEWTDGWFDKKEKYRTLRGGSWDLGRDLARCVSRDDLRPVFRRIHVGFRCART